MPSFYTLERYIFGISISWCPTELQKEPAQVPHAKYINRIGWDVNGSS